MAGIKRIRACVAARNGAEVGLLHPNDPGLDPDTERERIPRWRYIEWDRAFCTRMRWAIERGYELDRENAAT